MAYIKLSENIRDILERNRAAMQLSPHACRDENCIRRNMNRDRASIMRPAFVRDTEKIMNIPYYLRYSDKTQVFSLQKNDDISRRSYHVQLVSRIARNIGRMLNLNTELIEAIALGHDLGHTPFGHAGEKKLNEIYHARTGRYFNHNIQSARILEKIFPVNLSLQTLDGIICHNGEMELDCYSPVPVPGFEEFDQKLELCYTSEQGIRTLVPGTLEGCVMRVSDIIAYLGKDRQDAVRLGIIEDENMFSDLHIGRFNAEIINNMTVNLVENSYGKPFIRMDEEYFEAFSRAKKENYRLIYSTDVNNRVFEQQIYPMFEAVYDRLRKDLVEGNRDSAIYRHHLNYVSGYTRFYSEDFSYEDENIDDIVTDAIASMTDDYFIDLYRMLFPNGRYNVEYRGYFG